MASHAVWFYAGKLVWPVNLTFSYPRWTINPAEPLAYGWLVAGTGLGVAIYFARRFVGRGVEVAALFYVATLSPLLGFIMLYTFRYTFVADHYQYVASIGPLALAAAGISLALDRFEKRSPFLKPVCCGVLLAVLGVLTWRQSATYVNQETLWRTTLTRNPDCWMADNNLGVAIAAGGRFDEAIGNFRQAIQLNPNFSEAQNNLGHALAAEGRFDEAIENFRRAIQLDPNFSEALNNLGITLVARGRFDEAIENYRKAIQLDPNSSEALNNLGVALAAEGRFDEALENFRQAIQINPDFSEAQNNLGIALADKRQFDEAIENFHQAFRVNSNRPETFFHLGMALGQLGRTREMVAQSREALRLNPNLAGALNNLAWVLATGPDAELRNGAAAVRSGRTRVRADSLWRTLVHRDAGCRLCRSGPFPGSGGHGGKGGAARHRGRFDCGGGEKPATARTLPGRQTLSRAGANRAMSSVEHRRLGCA